MRTWLRLFLVTLTLVKLFERIHATDISEDNQPNLMQCIPQWVVADIINDLDPNSAINFVYSSKDLFRLAHNDQIWQPYLIQFHTPHLANLDFRDRNPFKIMMSYKFFKEYETVAPNELPVTESTFELLVNAAYSGHPQAISEIARLLNQFKIRPQYDSLDHSDNLEFKLWTHNLIPSPAIKYFFDYGYSIEPQCEDPNFNQVVKILEQLSLNLNDQIPVNKLINKVVSILPDIDQVRHPECPLIKDLCQNIIDNEDSELDAHGCRQVYSYLADAYNQETYTNITDFRLRLLIALLTLANTSCDFDLEPAISFHAQVTILESFAHRRLNCIHSVLALALYALYPYDYCASENDCDTENSENTKPVVNPIYLYHLSAAAFKGDIDLQGKLGDYIFFSGSLDQAGMYWYHRAAFSKQSGYYCWRLANHYRHGFEIEITNTQFEVIHKFAISADSQKNDYLLTKAVELGHEQSIYESAHRQNDHQAIWTFLKERLNNSKYYYSIAQTYENGLKDVLEPNLDLAAWYYYQNWLKTFPYRKAHKFMDPNRCDQLESLAKRGCKKASKYLKLVHKHVQKNP